MNLTNKIQAQEYLNKQLNERLTEQSTVNVNELFLFSKRLLSVCILG
jgi:hypothetical protein